MSWGMVDGLLSVERCMNAQSQQRAIHSNGDDGDVRSEFLRNRGHRRRDPGGHDDGGGRPPPTVSPASGRTSSSAGMRPITRQACCRVPVARTGSRTGPTGGSWNGSSRSITPEILHTLVWA